MVPFIFPFIFFKDFLWTIFLKCKWICFNIPSSSYMFRIFGHKGCEIPVSQPGIKSVPPALVGKVLTTGLPGKSYFCFYVYFCLRRQIQKYCYDLCQRVFCLYFLLRSTSRSSQFTCCWNLVWRILNIILLVCEMSTICMVIWTFFGITFLWD